MYRHVHYVLMYEDAAFEGDVQDEKKAKMENLRRRFIVGMRKETLSVQEERVGKNIFVKVSCSQDRLYEEAENMRIELPLHGMVLQNPEEEEAMIERRMKRIFNSGQKLKAQASAPFQRSCIEFFLDKNNPGAPIFWSSIKCLMVYNILSNINISRYDENGELPEKLGLSYLLMVKAFKDGFVLHDPSVTEPISMSDVQADDVRDDVSPSDVDLRRTLSKRWSGCCSRQPISEIRDYFGEKIAFYFSWVSLLVASLWLPALLGLIVFVFGLCRRLDHRQKRGVLYYIEIIKSSSDNELTPGFAAIICLWGTIFMEVWKRRQISLAHQWHVSNFDHEEPDRPQFQGTKSQLNPFTKKFFHHYPVQKRMLKYFTSLTVLLFMVMLVFISVTSVILYRVYMTVSFCREGDGLCDLVHGTLLATFLNTLSIMILGRIYEYIAVRLTEWENHQTLSKHNDALIIKLYAFQFANTYASLFYTAFFRRDFGIGILGLDKKYTDNCGHAENTNCMSLLSFQLLVLMIVKPFPKFVRDVIWPWVKKALHHCRLNEIDDFTTDGGITKQHYLLREQLKPSAEDFRLGEFTEKMIQYGYLVMFAASFPLAPALAVIFNIVDLKIDSKRLLWWNRRPTPYRDNDIGIWFHIINFINVCGVISNAFLIAFNSELGRDQPLEIKFAIIIGFEHFIFFIKFAISLIIPDVPTWVRNSERKERFLLSYLMTKSNSKSTPPEEPSIQVENGHNDLQNFENHRTEEAGLPKSRWSYG